MKVYRFRRTQVLPVSVEEIWDFFSDPLNLALITPAHLRFVIISDTGGGKVYSGQRIDYKVSVLPGIRMTWASEILNVQPPNHFTDVQLVGPFALWKHNHHFTATAGGVEIRDEVEFAIPLGWLGRLAKWAFVDRQLNAIFEYRHAELKKRFLKDKVHTA